MRIAWFAPLSVSSAVGQFSRYVCERLSHFATVEIWTDSQDPLHETDLRVVRYRDADHALARLSGHEILVYNIGNAAQYHRHILTLARTRPGIVILHDRLLDHMMVQLSVEGGGLDLYLDLIEEQHGIEARQAALDRLDREPLPWEDFLLRYPLFKHAVTRAAGVVVHSRSHAELVRGSYLGPVRTLFLPSYRAELPPGPPATERSKERLQLLTVGTVNPTKRLHEVIEALGRDQALAHRVRYVIAGPALDLRYSDSLARLVRDHALDETVSIVGQVTNDERDELLRGADILVALRYPSTEGGSAFLMEALETGKPVVVYDVGVFSEVPDDAVAKVPPRDTAALAAKLSELVADPHLRARIGAVGRVYAERHTIEAYARGLLDFIDEVVGARTALSLADRVAQALERMTVRDEGPVTERSVERIARLLMPLFHGLDGR